MKTITLAVTGSIAAYKAADLTSRLSQKGYRLIVLMTEAATQFITPLTLQTLSKNTVHTSIWTEENPAVVNHIELAKQTDLFLVAPASANTIAKLTYGLADNIVTSVALALGEDKIKVIAPAMNTDMYQNRATQENIARLKSRHYHEIIPKKGLLACGDFGRGALADVDTIITEIEALMQ